MTEGQILGLNQLEQVANASNGTLEVVSTTDVDEDVDYVKVEITVDCSGYEKREGGLPLRSRERLFIFIPKQFPFEVPVVHTAHIRWAGFPHVHWKKALCLYQSPSTEWRALDGMFGFLTRLDFWIQQGALGELDPTGAPLHPPYAHVIPSDAAVIIPRVDTPPFEGNQWLGLAHLDAVSPSRLDIVGWSSLSDEMNDEPSRVGAAILLSEPMPYDFPRTVNDLLEELVARGVSRALLFLLIGIAVKHNPEDEPLYLVLGTPARGIRGESQKQHLTVWYLNPAIAGLLRIHLEKYSSHAELVSIGQKSEDIVIKWAAEARVSWCHVLEDRPEITIRRDHGTSMQWFAGKTVALWGCGALGGFVAEFLARAGVGKLILRDKGIVRPGILVRQLFDEAEIGRAKAIVLRDRLLRINPKLTVEAYIDNILDAPLNSDWTDCADCVIDASASETVLTKLEVRHRHSSNRVPIASLVIGHEAKNGLLVLSRPNYSGGPSDICRRARLETYNRSELVHFRDEFWPKNARDKVFQPEPGCSENTFIGSAADVGVLSGTLLNLLASDLSLPEQNTASVHFIQQPKVNSSPTELSHVHLSYERDRVCLDPDKGYEIRIAESAWKEMQAWIKRSNRRVGSKTETGGLLFGEQDELAKIIWVREVIGPPRDSESSPALFICGKDGTQEIHREKHKRSGGSLQYVGMWHTHPESYPIPSATDFQAMERLLKEVAPAPLHSLLIIVGKVHTGPSIGAYLFTQSDFAPSQSAHKLRQVKLTYQQPSISKGRRVGLALSGGGSRAIAFHLGCLRALHDRGILEQIEVVSGVSGGSVIGAMYAYSQDSFADFDERVTHMLRSGLMSAIVKRALASPQTVAALGTLAISGTAALGADITRNALGVILRGVSNLAPQNAEAINRIRPPFRRWASRTTAFEEALRGELFGDTMLTDPRRSGVEAVFNACELRTGAAFRFGSRESGSWRVGKVIDNNISVAEAVAASAAYPVLLPALDRSYRLVDRHGNQFSRRVLLTDGGVYDNLGVTCMEPHKSEAYSYNVFHPDYIICRDAGAGLFSDEIIPYSWPIRMIRSFESVFRKVQNNSHERLHGHVQSGRLKGFVLSYLGQQDSRLPYVPTELVRREEVIKYPTNFSAMKLEDIERLSARGELLTRLILDRHAQYL